MRRIARRTWIASTLGLGLGAVGSVWWLHGEAEAGPPRAGWPPDPAAAPSTKQWLFTIRVKAGVPTIAGVRSAEVKPAQGTPRVLGRYALELWVGTELLDRVRFNVPLGAEGPREKRKPGLDRPNFDSVNTTLTVRMADHPRATQLRFVDRATAEVSTSPWPYRVPADAGPDAPRDAAPDAPPPDAPPPDAPPPDAPSADGGWSGRDAGLFPPSPQPLRPER